MSIAFEYLSMQVTWKYIDNSFYLDSGYSRERDHIVVIIADHLVGWCLVGKGGSCLSGPGWHLRVSAKLYRLLYRE